MTSQKRPHDHVHELWQALKGVSFARLTEVFAGHLHHGRLGVLSRELVMVRDAVHASPLEAAQAPSIRSRLQEWKVKGSSLRRTIVYIQIPSRESSLSAVVAFQYVLGRPSHVTLSIS